MDLWWEINTRNGKYRGFKTWNAGNMAGGGTISNSNIRIRNISRFEGHTGEIVRFNHERQLKSREFKARGVKYGGRREIFHDFNVQMGNIVRF